MSTAAGWPVLAAVVLVCAATVLISRRGLPRSRSTGDFYVASRGVSARTNASAIAGEYLSAASFLGVAGLILAYGSHGLWFPVGYTAGFLTLLLLVAAPLRRSGAYTLPDFIALRFRSARLRRLSALVAVMIGWLYVVPQLHGASLTLSTTAGLPGWVGPAVVVLVVLPVVLSGGMRSATLAQAVQYWIKFTALLVPTVFILLRLSSAGAPELPDLSGIWSAGLTGDDGGPELYRTVSLVLALMLGALGLPHVLVRFYTNPDGEAARRTTVLLLGMLGVFYLLPAVLGTAARAVLGPGQDGGPSEGPEPARADGTASDSAADTALLRLPGAVFDGAAGDLLTAAIAAGAFAAFLSTTSGLVVSVAGVLSQEFFGGTVKGFRLGALLALGLPLAAGTATSELALAGAVAMVFTFAAASLAPVLLLGIWWPRLTVRGAAAGLISGAVVSLSSLTFGLVLGEGDGAGLFLYPALWCIPLSFVVTVVASLLDRDGPPAHTAAVLARLHTPESRRLPGRPSR